MNSQVPAPPPFVVAAPATPPSAPQPPPGQAVTAQTTISAQPNKNVSAPTYCQIMASDPRASEGIIRALEAQHGKKE